jgi:hypothetical protein
MKTLNFVQMSAIKVVFLFILGFMGTQSYAGTIMKAYVTTGGDDLRGGNTAFIKVNYKDGTTSPEYVLSTGMGGNSTMTFSKDITKVITNINQIKNIEVRHDGSPRSGNPFDTYDNWNLQAIRVSFMINNVERNFINVSNNPLVRFTGQYRIHILAPQPAPPVPPATSKVKAYITTGTGELRGGNNAYMTVNYTNGTTSPEYTLGTGFGQNATTTATIDLGKVVSSISEIRSIVIRHDGSPRSGHPFDTYGNWTLQALRVALVLPNGTEPNIINLPGNPLVQFSGAVRTKTFNR